MERQFELRTKEANDQRLRDEYNLQQRLWDLEQQSRTSANDLIALTELQQRELVLTEECAYRDSLQSKFESEQRRAERG